MNLDLGCYSHAFSFFLPIRLYRPEQDLRRLVKINLASLSRLFDPQLLGDVVIATRGEDLAQIKAAVAAAELRFRPRVVDENEIVPSLGKLGGKGWFRQQVLKLFAWRVISSPYVILLDDDVVMTRRVGLEDLLMDGRLVMSHLHSDGMKEYFDSSCELLQFPRQAVAPDLRIMNVTPEIMVREQLQQLTGHIRQIWNLRSDEHVAEFLMKVSSDYSPRFPRSALGNFVERIRRRLGLSSDVRWSKLRASLRHWSEFTLYWVWLLKTNRTTEFYYDYVRDPHARQLNDQGIWSDDEACRLGIDGWIARTFSKESHYCFAVYSARVDVLDRDELYRRIEQELELIV